MSSRIRVYGRGCFGKEDEISVFECLCWYIPHLHFQIFHPNKTKTALEALPRVLDIMQQELNWTEERKKLEHENTVKFLLTMGLVMEGTTEKTNQLGTFFTRSHFFPHELSRYKVLFNSVTDNGVVAVDEIPSVFNKLGLTLSSGELDGILKECQVDMKRGVVEFNDFLEILGVFKERKSRSVYRYRGSEGKSGGKSGVERSGGGV